VSAEPAPAPAAALEAVRADPFRLDALAPERFLGHTLIVHEDLPGGAGLRRLDPPARSGWAADLRFALRLWRACGPRDALLLNQVDRFAVLACLLNRFWPGRRRRIALYDVFIDTPSAWRRRVVRWMVQGADLNVVFSRRQVAAYARRFGLPSDRFFFLPYQASHSKRPPVELAGEAVTVSVGGETRSFPRSGYVFSGGNSARDYRTLAEAVRGTGIPVVVVSTDDRLFAGLELPPEITRLRAVEPDFTRLMAGARLGVMCLTPGRDRGYGEQTILNTFWHACPMVAADDVSAADYIEEGVTGHVLAPGDAAGLRARLLDLWADPVRCRALGAAGQAKVRERFHHDHFVRRLVCLGLALAAAPAQGTGSPTTR
jgi:glycosyltransferase involved in cell wall biosynthesis